MQLHLILPAETPDMPFTELRELAVLAERLGYRGAWLPDHLLPPGRYEPGSYGGVFDPLVALAAIAGATSEIRLGTSVLVLPLRSPFVVAKQAATIERISAGRFTLGVGIGWDAAEFSTVGAEFTGRAARADEAIELIRQLLGGDGAFTGRHCGSPGGVFEPVPTGPVPIAVGRFREAGAAAGRAARRRVAADPPVPGTVRRGPRLVARELGAPGSRVGAHVVDRRGRGVGSGARGGERLRAGGSRRDGDLVRLGCRRAGADGRVHPCGERGSAELCRPMAKDLTSAVTSSSPSPSSSGA